MNIDQPSLLDQPPEPEPANPCPHCGRPMGDLVGTTGVPGRRATSQAAAQICRDTDLWEVLTALARLGPSTADRVARAVDKTPNQTATRLLELRGGGYARYATDAHGRQLHGTTSTGSRAMLQTITPAGEHALRVLR